jgi:hypothetical protein
VLLCKECRVFKTKRKSGKNPETKQNETRKHLQGEETKQNETKLSRNETKRNEITFLNH